MITIEEHCLHISLHLDTNDIPVYHALPMLEGHDRHQRAEEPVTQLAGGQQAHLHCQILPGSMVKPICQLRKSVIGKSRNGRVSCRLLLESISDSMASMSFHEISLFFGNFGIRMRPYSKPTAMKAHH